MKKISLLCLSLAEKLSDGKNTFDISHLSGGIYFVSIRQNKSVRTVKPVKE
jgi:hypothetical protein